MHEIVLASTSKYRRELVSRLKVPFTAEDPKIDESRCMTSGMSPQGIAEHLALEKAMAVSRRHPDAIVIGSDQLLALGSVVFGKPGNVEGAFQQLKTLGGKTHALITAMAVLHGTNRILHTDITKIEMESLSDDALRRYVANDMPVDCSGSYRIEGQGIALFRRIEGADPTAIQGLPLLALSRILRQLGVELP